MRVATIVPNRGNISVSNYRAKPEKYLGNQGNMLRSVLNRLARRRANELAAASGGRIYDCNYMYT